MLDIMFFRNENGSLGETTMMCLSLYIHERMREGFSFFLSFDYAFLNITRQSGIFGTGEITKKK